MGFYDDMVSCNPDFLEALDGRSGVYNGKTIDVLVVHNFVEQALYYAAFENYDQVVSITDDQNKGIAIPKHGDTLIFEGHTYAVMKMEHDDFGLWILGLTRQA
jgi:hypothetical protein